MQQLNYADNPNLPNILFMAEISTECVAISTFCRKHNRRGRFLIVRERLWELLNESPRHFYDMDCGHHVDIFTNAKRWTFTFDWLSEYSDGTLKGFRQSVEVPRSAIEDLLENGAPVRYLYTPTREAHAHIDTSRVNNTIREILNVPRLRRAFVKAMRDCFHWRDDEVTLYRDFRHSFYFEANGNWNINGGLVLHETERETPRGTFPVYYYGIHT